MNNKRCLHILDNMRDYMYAINTELLSNYQDGDYLLSKIKPIIHDANVLKTEFEYLLKEQQIKGGE